MKPTSEKNLELETKLREAAAAYHTMGVPTMSDADYDALALLHKKNRELSPEDPVWQDTILDKVGAAPLPESGFAKVKHRTPMLSLDNVFVKDDGAIDEVTAWMKGLSVELPSMTRLVAEPKIDGLSLSLSYVNGRLERAVTRGNGEIGDDVTRNVVVGKVAPAVLNLPEPGLLEVRGEVYMSFAHFEEINKEQEAAGEALYANPRNAAAGMLRRKDASSVRGLAFLAHGVTDPKEDVYEREMLRLQGLGLSAPPWKAVLLNGSVREDGSEKISLEWLQSVVEGLHYPVDGVVLKVSGFGTQAVLGGTSRAPGWAVAVKFAQEQVETTLDKITYQVGRSGVITPVAELAPVEIDGTIVSRASLHNEDQINRLGVRPGDRVMIRKAGAIIPEVVSKVPGTAPAGRGVGKDISGVDVAKLELRALQTLLQENGGRMPDDVDIHRRTAARLFNVPEEEVTPDQRRQAKQANLLAAYTPDVPFSIGRELNWTCPSCGEKSLLKVTTTPKPGDQSGAASTRWTCTNTHACPAQFSARVEYMASRDNLNIDQLGSEACDAIAQLVGQPLPSSGPNPILLTHPFDLRFASIDWFANLSWTTESGGNMTFGKARATRAAHAFMDASLLPLSRWIASLGIPHVGKNTSREITRLVRTVDALVTACAHPAGIFQNMLKSPQKYDEVKATFGISHHLGPVSVRHLVDFVTNDVRPGGANVLKLIPTRVRSDNHSPEPPKAGSGPLSGKIFVITGTLSLPREVFQREIEQNGGKVSGSISKKTDYLLAGSKAGSKLDKAQSLGVAVLSETEFKQMLA